MSTSTALAIVGAAVGSFFGPGGAQLGCIAHHQTGSSPDAQANACDTPPRVDHNGSPQEKDGHEHS